MPLRFGEVRLLGDRTRPDPEPSSIRVIQHEYGHEVAVIKYRYDEKFLPYLTRGAPISVVWGPSVHTTRFDGYVHHVVLDQRNAGASKTSMTVVCVGATDPLNAADRATYRDAHVDGLVSELARRNGFSVVIERHGFPWPVLQQQGESTWAFLVSCAKRIGYTLYARNTDLRCYSRAIRIEGAQTFRSDTGSPLMSTAAILSFQIVQAETLAGPTRKRDRVLTGVDQAGNSYVAQASVPTDVLGSLVTPQLTTFAQSPARSVAEADALLKGEQELNRHYIRAKATVSGNIRLHAASSVRLLGLSADHRGFWYVTRAEHMIDLNGYQVALEIGKDSLGDPAGASPPRIAHIPGDTARRAVVHDGRRPVTTGGQDASAPASVYADIGGVIPVVPVSISGRWRAEAPIERVLPAVRRRAREVVA